MAPGGHKFTLVLRFTAYVYMLLYTCLSDTSACVIDLYLHEAGITHVVSTIYLVHFVCVQLSWCCLLCFYGTPIVNLLNLKFMYVHDIVCYSYTIAARGLWGTHEWLSLHRPRGRSPSGLCKLKPRVCTP